jgi:hypothetical protein
MNMMWNGGGGGGAVLIRMIASRMAVSERGIFVRVSSRTMPPTATVVMR